MNLVLSKKFNRFEKYDNKWQLSDKICYRIAGFTNHIKFLINDVILRMKYNYRILILKLNQNFSFAYSIRFIKFSICKLYLPLKLKYIKGKSIETSRSNRSESFYLYFNNVKIRISMHRQTRYDNSDLFLTF